MDGRRFTRLAVAATRRRLHEEAEWPRRLNGDVARVDLRWRVALFAQHVRLERSYERNNLADTIQPSSCARATAIAVAASLVAHAEISEAISQRENTNDINKLAIIRASLIGKLAVEILAQVPVVPTK